ncbi:MAG TPA: hypothetical protein VFB38_14105 [Chthonomonadaceae bacterium]|nr:hypothetical protein [Chthonomonadaceae bacterium]
MKRNASPVFIVVAAVVLVGFLVVLYRHFFPPLPPADTENPQKMPGYAKQAMEFIKNHKPGEPLPPGMPGQAAPSPQGAPGR